MVGLCLESEKLGIKTTEMLAHQREQLNDVEQGMHRIKESGHEAGRHLNGMDKIWGLFSNPFDTSHKHKDAEVWKSNSDSEEVKSKSSRRVEKSDENDSSNKTSNGRFVTKITGDAKEDEMEQYLEQVNSSLGNMKNLAISIGNEIEASNKKLDVITEMTQINDTMIHRSTQRVEKQLK
ncbi:unnamed protein product [Orchesella dallaii]|uniref:t-SNARE coiled-coil homology domain-containing protein n=1 Tax=Orchesella dallaii TaxID=48710 RepID=A0ABP1RHP2_9HEXA